MHEPDIYSKGFHASVRNLTPAEKALFPKAELVREEERCTDAYWSARLFYRHRLATVLSPGNFIHIVAATSTEAKPAYTCEVIGQDVIMPAEYNIQLYSKKANVPDEHAIYSLHMSDKGGMGKRSMCDCTVCKDHRIFHAVEDMERLAYDENEVLRKKGITVPWHDPTDYCYTYENKLVFFEIESLDVPVIEASIKEADLTQDDREYVQMILARYASLMRQSRDAHLQSLAEFRIDGV